MHEQPTQPTGKKGLPAFLINNPLTSLLIVGSLLIAGFLYVTIRFATKKTVTPPDANALIGLSRRLYQEGDYDQSIAINEQLTQNQSAFWQTEMTSGNAYFKKGDYPSAIAHFQKAAALNPQLPLPYLNMALAYFRSGQPTEARTWYTYVIEHFAEEYPPYTRKAQAALECMEGMPPP